MAKISRDVVIDEALRLLDEVGLEGVSTRRLAQRLGVEQPSLYWHFARKSDLLSAMAEAAMVPHAAEPLPAPSDDWRPWFIGNYRSFRRTLLLHRDGARLHAGLLPGEADRERILHKQAFLIDSGLPPDDARMAMLAASRFTVGSVLEEQADDIAEPSKNPDSYAAAARIDHERAFNGGLALMVAGLSAGKV